MPTFTMSERREIIEDFAREIANRKRGGHHPETSVIKFRNELKNGTERKIFYVPIELLRYRKDNGRIASDVRHYEKSFGLLVERTKEAQQIIEEFLSTKNEEKTKEMYRLIQKDGQSDPAIITCDGFLINGNRRKLAIQQLNKDFPGRDFNVMKVVILPGHDDEGGPPTLYEIEQLENRYQLQSEGKAEYYNFDRALSMRRKIGLGMTLEEQLRDDPNCALLGNKQFNEAVKKCEREYLGPLDCIDRYLSNLKRDELYGTVSTSIGDPEGRWQAFKDYYNSLYQRLKDSKERHKLGINENEVGVIEDIAFKIIRKREFPNTGLPKVHKIMREMPKWLKNPESKSELLKLRGIEDELPSNERYGPDGKEYDERGIDREWARKNATKINKHVIDAFSHFEHRQDQETPISILQAALKKLSHEELKPDKVATSDYEKIMEIAREIQDRANEIEHEFYQLHKELPGKFNNLRSKFKR